MAYMTNNRDDDFDKFFSRMFKIGVGWIITCALVGLGITGVIIWAVIALVLHFT